VLKSKIETLSMETPIHHQEGAAGASSFPSHQYYTGSWSQRISWPAVFAGVILAVFLQLALTLLGIAIGMGTIDAVNGVPGEGLAIGSGIYSIISLMFSLFTGGWVAGRLAKNKHTSESVIHGVLVAGLLFILTFYLLSSAVSNLIGGVGSIAGSAITKAAPSLSNAIEDRYQPGTAAGEAQLTQDSAKIAAEIAQHKEEMKAAAVKVANQAAETSAKAAIYSFLGLLLGTVAAGYGAKKGRDSKVPDDYYAYYNDVNRSNK
jgi:hypothetical protein